MGGRQQEIEARDLVQESRPDDDTMRAALRGVQPPSAATGVRFQVQSGLKCSDGDRHSAISRGWDMRATVSVSKSAAPSPFVRRRGHDAFHRGFARQTG